MVKIGTAARRAMHVNKEEKIVMLKLDVIF